MGGALCTGLGHILPGTERKGETTVMELDPQTGLQRTRWLGIHVTHASCTSQDFVTALSILLRGTVHEKLRWTFNLYDINKDGYINKEVSELRPGGERATGRASGYGRREGTAPVLPGRPWE